MLAKVNTVDNYCPELQFIEGLKIAIQVCQCCYFVCKEHEETNKSVRITFETNNYIYRLISEIIPSDTARFDIHVRFSSNKDRDKRTPHVLVHP